MILDQIHRTCFSPLWQPFLNVKQKNVDCNLNFIHAQLDLSSKQTSVIIKNALQSQNTIVNDIWATLLKM
jgi:hypothetical protein